MDPSPIFMQFRDGQSFTAIFLIYMARPEIFFQLTMKVSKAGRKYQPFKVTLKSLLYLKICICQSSKGVITIALRPGAYLVFSDNML